MATKTKKKATKKKLLNQYSIFGEREGDLSIEAWLVCAGDWDGDTYNVIVTFWCKDGLDSPVTMTTLVRGAKKARIVYNKLAAHFGVDPI